MFAFALPFHMIYGSVIREFATLDGTMFMVFRGLQGDLPLDDMLAVDTLWTRLLIISFVTVMVFTVMTILIAIISEQYENSKEISAKQLRGVWSFFYDMTHVATAPCRATRPTNPEDGVGVEMKALDESNNDGPSGVECKLSEIEGQMARMEEMMGSRMARMEEMMEARMARMEEMLCYVKALV